MESKIEKAVELFKEGYNCSQSVVAAYAEDYGFTREQALKIAASFGGGIGRMRQTCGAACGLFMLAGLETGCTDGKSREGKEENYKTVQMLAQEFRLAGQDLVTAEPDARKAWRKALREKGDSVLICAGSLYLAGEILAAEAENRQGFT